MVASNGDGGACEWKRNANGVLPSECEAEHQCAAVYGKPEAFQTSTAFAGRQPLERWGDNDWNYQISTNTPEQWSGGQWLEAGEYTLCVSLPTLTFWRCQKGEIRGDGKAYKFGQDGDKGFNLNK